MKLQMRHGIVAIALLSILSSPAFAEGIDIFQAAREGNIEQIESYAKTGKSLDVQDEKGNTPFIVAAYNQHPDAVNVLLSKGANACLADSRGQTALMGVSFKGYLDIAKLLTERCDVNAKSNAGQTALMFAALFGRQEVARLLLDNGADPKSVDIQGKTPEDLAKSQGNEAMVALISEYAQKKPLQP